MANPISGSNPEAHLPSVKINPGDEKLLDSPFGKMLSKTAGDTDQATLIKEIKLAINQYCKDIVNQMKKDQERSEKAMKQIRNVAEGKDMYD